MIFRILSALACFDLAVCKYMYQRTRSPYWQQLRARAAQDVDTFERRVQLEQINGIG